MFEGKTRLTERLADAVDLVIDFATLGEYGFEPVAEPAPPACTRRRRERGSEPHSQRLIALNGSSARF